MNREEARLELDATTLRPQDATPEARAMLESDAELAAWHEKRTAFDEEVAAVLANLPVTAGLRENILRAAETPAKRPVHWITPTAIAAAACVLFGWILLWPGNSAMAAWESESLAAVAKVEYGVMRLDERAESLEAVKKHLTLAECPCPSALPPALAGLRTYGCKRVQIDGHAATIICFELQPGKEAHLVVLDNTNLSNGPADDAPCFKSAKNWRYASWNHGSHAFMLATTADAAALKKLFGLT
ncbi:hypothetical protein [Prosthecobacter sp.]|uniref:hypothetical protein n=1 Tax=Prosthecobacter sp. TaxID=1965333 RepID=UPI002ABCA22A|nr:hypothetical protein [Prosthecobacter sp.]MDZ4406145.1 hypothetical protein [Prosthecobacter sp.]